MSEKVKFLKVTSATLEADNSADDARQYAVSSRVTIDGQQQVTQHTDGQVASADGAQQLATFSAWGGQGNLNIQFIGAGADVQAAVLQAVNQYIADAATAAGLLKMEKEEN